MNKLIRLRILTKRSQNVEVELYDLRVYASPGEILKDEDIRRGDLVGYVEITEEEESIAEKLKHSIDSQMCNLKHISELQSMIM